MEERGDSLLELVLVLLVQALQLALLSPSMKWLSMLYIIDAKLRRDEIQFFDFLSFCSAAG